MGAIRERGCIGGACVVVVALAAGMGVARAGQQVAVGELWAFDGAIGDVVEIVGSTEEFDITVELLGPGGEVVGVDDDGGMGTNARLLVFLQKRRTVFGTRWII